MSGKYVSRNCGVLLDADLGGGVAYYGDVYAGGGVGYGHTLQVEVASLSVDIG